jgi:hypothetical protein
VFRAATKRSKKSFRDADAKTRQNRIKRADESSAADAPPSANPSPQKPPLLF